VVLADSLSAAVTSQPELPVARRDYLLSEIGAMRTTLRILQGESLRLDEEVRRLYGITPTWVDESSFAEIHSALDSILPGRAPLAQRVTGYLDQMNVPAGQAAAVIDRIAAHLRELTRSQYPLPQQETCEFTVVHDKPWAAYNWYLGSSRSRIEFNLDRPLQIDRLPFVVGHEAYPGHHTERALKEERLFKREGRLEHSIFLCNTPSQTISEGIAMNALDVIADRGAIVSMYADILGLLGRSREEASRLYDFHAAHVRLGKVTSNQLFLLHDRGASEDEVIAYGMRYALNTESLEKELMKFRKNPLWRSYGFNYTLGADLVKAYLDRAPDKQAAYDRILGEAMTPAQVAAAYVA
jgi:hypothetical protein